MKEKNMKIWCEELSRIFRYKNMMNENKVLLIWLNNRLNVDIERIYEFWGNELKCSLEK